MPVVRISDESMKRLEAWADPLEDTLAPAFARVLDAAGNPAPVAPVRRKLAYTPVREFRRPLMETLYDMGSGVPVLELRPAFRKRMAPRLLPDDLVPVGPGGMARWWNNLCRARNALKKEGYLRDDSKQGMWELSEKGAALVERWRGEAAEDAGFDVRRSRPRSIEP